MAASPAALRARKETLYAESLRTGYRHIQDAVNAARLPGSRILVLPGLYREEPSLAEPSGAEVQVTWQRTGDGLAREDVEEAKQWISSVHGGLRYARILNLPEACGGVHQPRSCTRGPA